MRGWDAARGCKQGKARKIMMAGETGLEPAASGVTGRRSNQLSYSPASIAEIRPIR